MVSTEEGPRAVEELTKGTRVWGLNKEENGLEIGTVKDVWQSGVDPIYSIKTKAGVFRCNGRHRLFVRRRFYTPQDGPGDHKKVTWKNIWLQADEITTKDYLLAPASTPSEAIDPPRDGHESPPGNEYDLNGIIFVPVSGISVGDPEPVYDLTVDGTATYIANGFISHNSRGFGGKCVRSDEQWVTPSGEVTTWGEMEGKSFPIMAPVEGGVVKTTALAEDNGRQKVWNITLRSGITISRTAEHPIYSALPKRSKAVLPRLRFASVINRGHIVLVPDKLAGTPSVTDKKDENLLYFASLLGDPKFRGKAPDWILKCPERQLKIFLNRLFTRNEQAILLNQGRYPNVRFLTASEDVGNLLNRAMHRLGVPGQFRGFQSRVIFKDRDKKYYDTFSWSPLPEFMPEFFETIGQVPGKEETCETIIRNIPPVTWKRTEAPEGYHWDSVMSVTTEEDVPTTTICVPEGNMFCGPVVEHNSFLLALLSLTEQVVLGASVNLLGGSGEQARRVLQYLSGDDPNSMGVLWDSPNAPKWMHPDDFTKTVSRTINGGLLKTLAASQTSIRGPHPSRLRLDECLAYNQRVSTSDGPKMICYVAEGTKVWCWDGEGFVEGTVKKAICKGKRRTTRLHLSTGRTLVATGNHPVLTKQGWKHAEDCSKEDILLGGPLEAEDVRIIDITPGNPEEVWDLQVSPHHNFVAEGVVVHNCDELDIDLFDAAMGQTMSARGIRAQTVASCFAPETTVTLESGAVLEICEIREGMRLRGPTGKVQTVTATHRRWLDGEILRVSPRGLPDMRVTKEHMLISGEGELPVEAACEHRLLSPNWHMTGANNSFDAGWLVGLYLAEGNLRYPPDGRSYEVTFSVHYDEAEILKQIIEDWGKRRYPTKNRPIMARIYKDTRGECASVRVTSRGLHGLISRWVKGRKSYCKELKQLPTTASFARGLIQGWLGGDGTNYPISHSILPDTINGIGVSGTTTSRNLAWQIYQIAMNAGYIAALKNYAPNKSPLVFGYRRYWSVNIHKGEDSRYYTRKIANAKRPQGLLRKATVTPEPYTGWVYDLTVTPDHLYIANGILCHNSTHQHAFGTMSTLLQRARENSWLVHEWCVAEGSLVLTDRGEIPIESVAPGMKVATRKGWRSVQHRTYVGDKRVLSIDVSNGRVLRVTADHKVATPMGWLEARHLMRGLPVVGVDLSRGFSLQQRSRYVEGLSWTNIPEAVPVYDIGVEDCHEFVVEGIVVHNCYRENLKSNGGWLDDEEVTRKKNEVTRDMWEIEYENQAPNPESYAIDPDAVDALFDRSLGVFPGRMQETVVIDTPKKATRHYHGADWARSRDSTIIHTMAEVPGERDVLTHWTRTGRVSWPLMISKFNERVKKLGGPACHDSTGLGAVVDDYIKVPAYGINLQSQVRADIFNEFIVAIERGDQMVFPFIESMYQDFKYASWEDIFGGKHPPDSFVAAALAWEAKRRGSRLNIFRL